MGLLLLLAEAAYAAPPGHVPDTVAAGLVVGLVSSALLLGLALLAVSFIIQRDGTRIGGAILGFPLPIALAVGAMARTVRRPRA